MITSKTTPHSSGFDHAPASLRQGLLLGLLLVCSTGCSMLNPLRGVPASYLPGEFEGPRRGGKRTINPSLLVQTPPDQHRVAAGDILSIYIPGVLGRREAEIREQAFEYGIEPPINLPFRPEDPPTVGYPIAVRDDHTISLPQIPPIRVLDKTIREVEQAIRRAYTEDFAILQPEEALILVSLQRPRVHRVLVVRQETGNELAQDNGIPGAINLGVSKRGTARVVTLNAYENDVLHALASEVGVDGLPGLDAENTIYVIRRRHQSQQQHIPHNAIPSQPLQRPAGHTLPATAPPSMHQRESLPGTTATQRPSSPLVFRGQDTRLTSAHYQFPDGYRDRSTEIQRIGHSFSGGHVPQPYSQYLAQASHDRELLIPPIPHNNGLPNSTPPQPGSGGPVMPHYPNQFPVQPGPTGMPSQPQPVLQPSPSFTHPQSAPQGYREELQQFPTPAQPGIGHAQPSVPIDASTLTPHWSTALHQFDPTIDNPNVIRIPIRLGPGENPQITEEMITLYDGDIVFIESRETDVFYTGGLLGGGQFTLPREYDLGVLEAISIAEGRNQLNGGDTRTVGGVSALNRDVSVSASRVIILRTLATGQRITIEVDLHKAMRYQEENILVQPGDMLILQFTPGESIAAFTQRFLLEGALFSLAAAQLR